MEPRERATRYKKALAYLDGCGVLTLDKLRKANEIAGSNLSEFELRKQWDDAACILPSGGNPGGPEYLRVAMRQALSQGIKVFGSLGSVDSKKWWQFWK
jgi:hypothetical protein